MKSENRKIAELREYAAYEAILSVAEDHWEYFDGRLDKIFAVCNYLYSGLADMDQLIAEIQVGKKNPNEILRWQRDISLTEITKILQNKNLHEEVITDIIVLQTITSLLLFKREYYGNK